jgi:hypothetical protein
MKYVSILKGVKTSLFAICLIAIGATSIVCMRQQIAKNARYSSILEDRLELIHRKTARLVVQIAHIESPSYVCAQIANSMAAPADAQIIEVSDDCNPGENRFSYARHALAFSQNSLKR